ncbi:hypothetical protein AMATHDRAFT_55679 [Amanita thiersii Skay4041]|uniref:Aerobactin siderophore biosynthesis IucA/IucC N-terminal domain-containing protein n=1 Tax=Amanita thiersii Skay4041 TaxID=703135 RepID=A0A2A9NYT2_9AGAR|nr:hypothetical protein AMATHDRAFT_55679 [Amanita thiersii Skay4041]
MFISSTRFAHLTPNQRAAFSVLSRLISCLVTESLLSALFFPLSGIEAKGFAVILLGKGSTADDIFSVVPLQEIPVLRPRGQGAIARTIGLLDPLDMKPFILILSRKSIIDQRDKYDQGGDQRLITAISSVLNAHGWPLGDQVHFEICWCPTTLWNIFADNINLKGELKKEIAADLLNSQDWQRHSYENPPEAPQFTSTSIEWEQSIVEGHPTHPVHKMRSFLPPIPDYTPGSYNLYAPLLRFIAVPRDQLIITYDFERYIKPLLEEASCHVGQPPKIPNDYVIIPVHEVQVANIQQKFPEVEILPNKYHAPMLAQQGIRSVQVLSPQFNLNLKLAVGIRLTSAQRTISPAAAYFSPRFSTQVVPHLNLDSKIVTVVKELASVVHAHPNPEIAKHCAAIVREAPENAIKHSHERLIVCTALVESGHAGADGHIPAVIRVFGLDTEDKRADWLDKFVRIFFRAFLPPALYNGVALECHPQNCMARFDINTKELLGFVIRDFGGIRVHPETLKASTGVEVDFLTGHSVIAPDMDDVYKKLYHAAIHNHLQQLIRVLGLHYNGRGWKIVRSHLKELVPKDHSLYDAWLSAERTFVPEKCFIRMRIAGMYRFYLENLVPNLILYNGVEKNLNENK